MEYIQNFNYHTQTPRCGHTENDYKYEEYVKYEFITRQICELVQKYQVPMEINLNEI